MPRTLQDIQDELLVIRCQDGEADALDELIVRWQVRLHAHAWSLTRDADAAADASQEAWLAIARGVRRLSDPTYFGPWAYRIVTHKCADWTRAQQRRRALVKGARDERPARPEAEPHHDDDATCLRDALGCLQPDSRGILSMYYLGQMNVNQIAMALDIPAGTVKSRLYHAREALKAAFERQES